EGGLLEARAHRLAKLRRQGGEGVAAQHAAAAGGGLVEGQRRGRGAQPRPAVAGMGTGLALAQYVQGALETGQDEVVLVGVVIVERSLGDVQPRRDLVDRGAVIALFVDELGGGDQEALARRLGGRRDGNGPL